MCVAKLQTVSQNLNQVDSNRTVGTSYEVWGFHGITPISEMFPYLLLLLLFILFENIFIIITYNGP